jgi:hypothetical protein
MFWVERQAPPPRNGRLPQKNSTRCVVLLLMTGRRAGLHRPRHAGDGTVQAPRAASDPRHPRADAESPRCHGHPGSQGGGGGRGAG